MPLIIIKSSASNISTDTKQQIHEQTVDVLTTILQKSSDYVMSILELDHEMSFARNSQLPTAYIEVKNVGTLVPESTLLLSRELTAIISKNLEIAPDRVYIEFQQSDRHLWGWNGRTFA